MINPFTDVNWNPDIAERRKFGRTLLLGLPIIALLLALAKRFLTGQWHWEPAIWIAAVGITVGLISLATPSLARPFYVVWYGIACCIGIVMTNLLLAVFYYLAFTPISLLKHALGKKTFRKGFQKGSPTYWQEAKHAPDRQRYYNQF